MSVKGRAELFQDIEDLNNSLEYVKASLATYKSALAEVVSEVQDADYSNFEVLSESVMDILKERGIDPDQL